MGNPDKIVAVGLGEVLYDHDVVTDEYTFGGAPANFADHFLKCSRLISGPDAAEVHVVSAVGDDERGRAVSAELEARGLCDGLCRVGELPTGVVDKRRDAAKPSTFQYIGQPHGDEFPHVAPVKHGDKLGEGKNHHDKTRHLFHRFNH